MRSLWAACAFALAAAAYGAEGELSAGAGANYSTGKYGDSTPTRIWSIPFLARYETDRWTLKLTVPYLRVTSPANVIPGVGRFDESARLRRRRAAATESGLGDAVASATYTAYYHDA